MVERGHCQDHRKILDIRRLIRKVMLLLLLLLLMMQEVIKCARQRYERRTLARG